MLSLILWRHAKSSWTTSGLADHERPLNNRGRRAAPLMAAQIADKGLTPQRILCSTALRTRETLAALLPYLRRDAEIVLTRDIYHADTADLLAMIRAQPAASGTLMVIGHNPTLEELAGLLGGRRSDDGNAPGAHFPTAAVAHFRFSSDDWASIDPDDAALELFVRPRDLEA